ncbi:hypothetical protein EPN54_04175 [bacterium]|nr:MAG: hypothetical protein EPN54_04175 [bacterium]
MMTTGKRTLKILCVTLYFLVSYFSGPALCQKDAKEDGLPNIILVLLTGVRNTESIADPTHQYFPNLWNEMLKEGVLYSDLVDINYEFHMPAFNAINTGGSYNKDTKITAPSISQYVRKKYSLPATKLWTIGHWWLNDCVYETKDYSRDTYPCEITFMDLKFSPELKTILTRQELVSFNNYQKVLKGLATQEFDFILWDGMSEGIYQIFIKKIMPVFKPKLVLYVMDDPDSAHYDSFSRYVLTLKRCDERIFEIWRTITNDKFYKGKTYLFVCIDHERNPYYMQHSENAYDNPSHVWMYVYGPGVKRGKIINRPIKHTDIFATIADITGIKTNKIEGKVLKDCFI